MKKTGEAIGWGSLVVTSKTYLSGITWPTAILVPAD